MKGVIRKVLSAFGLMLSSDHDRFRKSCVEFCEEFGGKPGVVVKSSTCFRAEHINSNIFVVGDNTQFLSCTVKGEIACAPWTKGHLISGCVVYGKNI